MTTDGIFTVKYLYSKVISEDGVDNFLHEFVWVHGIPPKVNFFLWCDVHGRLNSQDRLQYKGVDIDSSCRLCGDSTESQDHILLHCKVAHKVWSSVTPSDNWAWAVPDSFYNLASCWNNTPLSGNAKMVWKLLPVVWVLWKERNCRVFEENYTYKLDEELCCDAKTLVLTWAAAFGNTVHLNFAYTVKNWNIVFS
ncbi:uncharacterized protein LOC113341864 [Papaver somniferum]|uniref:uncharacterized protein LOC113341864 n=1 Tax=Papaver somniferum TaxID=3469 RepID=UPI000E6F667C|nr:uncharacterized protein LOC113341864 [Papaver somniferum]